MFRCYDDVVLSRYKAQPPFYTHPYAHWRSYSLFKPADRLDYMAERLLSVPGFDHRLEQARQNAPNPENFFGFATEVKVGYFLRSQCYDIEFVVPSNRVARPDLLVESEKDLYIEVHTPTKQFMKLERLQEELRKVNPELRLERVLWSNPDEIADFDDVIQVVKLTLQDLQITDETPRNVTIWTSPTSGNIVLKLDTGRGEYHGERNAHCDPLNTLITCMNESLKDKTNGPIRDGCYPLKNGLDRLHPSILWSELLYRKDFAIGVDMRSIDWAARGLPRNLDAQVITVSGIDQGYEKPHLAIALINGKSMPDTISSLKSLFARLFRGIEGFQPIILEKTAEELGIDLSTRG